MTDVAVVIPVYNEEACIHEVMQDWLLLLASLDCTYLIIVLNDGSRDNTAEVLLPFEKNPHVQVINKKNAGHGPTILTGYHLAVNKAQWVFQVDGDNEMAACHFKKIWAARRQHDAVIGVRDGRVQPLSRKAVSTISRLVVNFFYGRGVKDVNCPYRLMKSEFLKEALMKIPPYTFAPNVVIAGLLAYKNKNVINVPVPHNDRQTGEVSIKKWKLLSSAIKSCVQVISIRVQLSFSN